MSDGKSAYISDKMSERRSEFMSEKECQNICQIVNLYLGSIWLFIHLFIFISQNPNLKPLDQRMVDNCSLDEMVGTGKTAVF